LVLKNGVTDFIVWRCVWIGGKG